MDGVSDPSLSDEAEDEQKLVHDTIGLDKLLGIEARAVER
jgi:hypothetical protein